MSYSNISFFKCMQSKLPLNADLIFFYRLRNTQHMLLKKNTENPTCNLPSKDLAIVIHLVLESWVDMAFSSSSKVLFFLSFFTNDLTAFSDHFSSCSFLASPLRHPRRRFTIGGVNGNMEVMPHPPLNKRPRPFLKLKNQWFLLFLYRFLTDILTNERE